MRVLDRLTARRILEGDADAFESLVYTYKNRVFSYCLRMCQDTAAAEDVAQEVFVKVYRHIGQYQDEKASLSTWIYAICRTTCLNWLRNRRQEAECHETGIEEMPDLRYNAAIRGMEDRMRLTRLLQALSEEDRDLLLLKDYLDLSCREVAEITGLPTGTVKSRLHAVRKRLQNSFEEGERS